MDDSISEKKLANNWRFLILRSLYYKQNLPSKLVYGLGWPRASAEISAMIQLKLIKRIEVGLEMTELGREYLFSFTGNRKPPMIDIDHDALLPRKKRAKFIVGSSLAADIYREVRNGE